MKRIVISSLLLLTACDIFAQSANKAKDLLKANKTQEAKTEIDKVLSNEKNAKDAEAWYVKSKVYSEIANDDKLNGSVPDAREVSFEAVKKYAEVADKNLVSLTLDNYKP